MARAEHIVRARVICCRMWRVLKIAFLYIGTIIGAGFASGREISVFFGDTAPLGVALSALFMAALAALFMTAGKLSALPDGTAVRTGVVIASFSSVAAMLAGGEFALQSVFGVPSLGVVMAVAAGVTVTLGIEKIKVVSTVLIPLLIALLVVIYVKVGAPVFQGSFSLVKPLHYSGLDVLLGGIVIAREGKKLNGKQIVGVAVLCALAIGVMLFILQNIVLSDDLRSSMPVLAVAEKVGLKSAAGILIVIAIFTTLISSLDVLVDYVRQAFALYAERHPATRAAKPSPMLRFARFCTLPANRRLAVFLPLPVLYAVSLFGFDLIVDSLYPFVGLCGMAMTAGTALKLVRLAARKFSKSKPEKKAPSAGGRNTFAFAAPSAARAEFSGDDDRNRSRNRRLLRRRANNRIPRSRTRPRRRSRD